VPRLPRHATAARPPRTARRLETRVRRLQRDQRPLDVAGQLQLLAGDQQHLLDLGQRDFVAGRGEIAVQRLERRLLRLRFGEALLEQRDLRLRVAQVGRGLALRATDRDTGRAKGFGFVEMGSAEEAQKAIDALNGKSLDGRAITVNVARPREERAGGGGGGGRREYGGGGGGGGRNRY